MEANQPVIIINKATMIKKNEKKIEDVYKMGKKALGTGGFGVVTKCRHRVTKLDRACKTIPRKKVRNIE